MRGEESMAETKIEFLTKSSGEAEQPFRYSVGKWVDETTLVTQTVGMMPENRVWLDSTGRPISDQLRVEETWHRGADEYGVIVGGNKISHARIALIRKPTT